jgi:hypothetical protein
LRAARVGAPRRGAARARGEFAPAARPEVLVEALASAIAARGSAKG